MRVCALSVSSFEASPASREAKWRESALPCPHSRWVYLLRAADA
jgi:hypothetical protein